MSYHSAQRALMALPPARVKQAAAAVSSAWSVAPVSLSESGLAMLQLRDGAFRERFNLGEFPLASAHVRIEAPPREAVMAAALIMSDDPDLAESMAVLDAVLTHDLPGVEAVLALVREGSALNDETDRVRNTMLARTRVDFSLLESTEDEHAD